MKASVYRIIVFSLTLGAHFKLTHSSLGAVIRDVLNDSKSGPTVSAVSEGIVEAAVGGGEDLPLAIFAGSDIW